jgi:hypothetical protein
MLCRHRLLGEQHALYFLIQQDSKPHSFPLCVVPSAELNECFDMIVEASSLGFLMSRQLVSHHTRR